MILRKGSFYYALGLLFLYYSPIGLLGSYFFGRANVLAFYTVVSFLGGGVVFLKIFFVGYKKYHLMLLIPLMYFYVRMLFLVDTVLDYVKFGDPKEVYSGLFPLQIISLISIFILFDNKKSIHARFRYLNWLKYYILAYAIYTTLVLYNPAFATSRYGNVGYIPGTPYVYSHIRSVPRIFGPGAILSIIGLYLGMSFILSSKKSIIWNYAYIAIVSIPLLLSFSRQLYFSVIASMIIMVALEVVIKKNFGRMILIIIFLTGLMVVLYWRFHAEITNILFFRLTQIDFWETTRWRNSLVSTAFQDTTLWEYIFGRGTFEWFLMNGKLYNEVHKGYYTLVYWFGFLGLSLLILPWLAILKRSYLLWWRLKNKTERYIFLSIFAFAFTSLVSSYSGGMIYQSLDVLGLSFFYIHYVSVPYAPLHTKRNLVGLRKQWQEPVLTK